MLRAVMQAEKASLARIVGALAGVPEERHAALVGVCLQRVAGRFVVDP